MIKKLMMGAAVMVAATTAQAQTGTVNVSASVVTPITFTNVRDLTFTNVFPGQAAKVVAASDAGSGGIRINGLTNAQVAVSAGSMSSTLTCASCTGTGPNSLTLSVDGAARVNNASAAPTGAGSSAFTLATSAANTNLNAAGQLWLYIGGSVAAAANQQAGSYTGSISLNVSYTGN
jgi:hypothetical protein